MASETSIATGDRLHGTTTLTTWLEVGAQCCGYHTFTINSKDPNLVLFGHQGICEAVKQRIYVDGVDFFAIYSAVDGPLPGFYPVTETLASPPFVGWHKLKYENGKPIIWYVKFEDIREFLVDSEVIKYYEDGRAKDDDSEENGGGAKNGAGFESRNENEKKDNNKEIGSRDTSARTSPNTAGEDVPGSGSPPRRMTRGHNELGPQMRAFSATNENTPAAQPSQNSPFSIANTTKAHQILLICPYHGTDRCEGDDLNWFDRRQHHDYHPADSCSETNNRESREPEFHVPHHYRSHLRPTRLTNYRPTQVELHHEGVRVEQDATDENEKVALDSGASGWESDSDEPLSCEATPAQNSNEAVSMSGSLEDMGYGSNTLTNATEHHGPTERPSQIDMASQSDSHQSLALKTEDVSGIIFPEKCRCFLRMVKDYGQPEYEVPLIWQSCCSKHNPNVDGKQPWQLYVETHGTAPPPYQHTVVSPPDNPQAPKPAPTVGLRGGAPARGDSQNQGSKAAENPLADSLNKHAEGILSVAEELQKYSFGSDAPMAFGRSDESCEARNGSNPPATGAQKPETDGRPSKGLRGGTSSRRSKWTSRPSACCAQPPIECMHLVHDEFSHVHDLPHQLRYQLQRNYDVVAEAVKPLTYIDDLELQLEEKQGQLNEAARLCTELEDEARGLKERNTTLYRDLVQARTWNDINGRVLANINPYDVGLAAQIVRRYQAMLVGLQMQQNHSSMPPHFDIYSGQLGAPSVMAAPSWGHHRHPAMCTCGQCTRVAGLPAQHADSREQHSTESGHPSVSVHACFHPQPSEQLLQNGGPSSDQFHSGRQKRHDGVRKTVPAQARAFEKTSLPEWWENHRPQEKKANDAPVMPREENPHQEVKHQPKHKKWVSL